MAKAKAGSPALREGESKRQKAKVKR